MLLYSNHEIRECQVFITKIVNNKSVGDLMKIFGDRLKELRKDKKLTQNELAKQLKVSGNTVYSWENDKQEPSMATLLKLSEIFEVSLDFLFGKSDY